MTPSGTITWWGSASVQLGFDGRSLVVDPYLHPTTTPVDYVLITREDHDHCHEPTIERLASEPSFKGLIVPRSCTIMSTLDSPVLDGARDLEFVHPELLTVLFPKYKRKAGSPYPESTELTLEGFQVEAVESSDHDPVNIVGSEFLGKRYRPETGEAWPAGTGRYAGIGALPTLGYVISELRTETTFYHPGDLQEAFDSQRQLRGRIDYLFLPMATLEGVELSVIDNVRPRYVVPICYRLPEPDFPIPLEIGAERLTTTDLFQGRPVSWADPDVYRAEIRAMMRAHWYPTPVAPLERLHQLEPAINELGAELLVLAAGQEHEIPALAHTFGRAD